MSDLMELLFSEREALDAVHLHPGESPRFEGKNTLNRLEGPPVGPKETQELLTSVASAEDLREFNLEGMVCFEFQFRGVAVFKIMAFREGDEVRLEIRSLRWL